MTIKSTLFALFFCISSLLSAATPLRALNFDPQNANCYEFLIIENPEDEKRLKPTQQIWCYHKGKVNSSVLFVFNADQTEVKQELAFTVDAEKFITHASLLMGQITFHKVKGTEYNPFHVPFEEPRLSKKVGTPWVDPASAEAVLDSLSNAIVQQPSSFILQEGEYSSFATAAILPWRGFWWPYKGQPLSGSSNSPMAKYDRFVQARTGSNPGAQSWENRNHRYKGVNWEGHCNGWAASAILRPEPRFSKTDSVSGVTFTVADQKGLLAETDYCVATAFFGSRNRGRSTDNPRDIFPPLFHKTLLYYIGNLRKPVVLDYSQGSAVNNQPVSGYSMSINRTSSNSFQVTARLTFHRFDSRSNFPPGIAPAYIRTYRYTLTENSEGTITGGSWLSINPDFIWVPLAIRDCGSNNPLMSHANVQSILNLPRSVGSPMVLWNENTW